MKASNNERRDFIKTSSGLLLAAALPFTASGQSEKEDMAEHYSDRGRSWPIYLNGCGWDRSMPGVFGQACFAFEMRAVIGGTGVGTIRDDVHPEINSQFQVTETIQRPGSEYVFRGSIIASRSPELIGLSVTISARSTGKDTAEATLTIESADQSLVVIAIIMPLIALLLPARQ